MADELARENLRLARRVKRLETTLEQVELIRDANAALLSRVAEELDVERQRSHDLLLNVLPARIVARLEVGETLIADRYPHVCVLLSDFVGFTGISGRLEPAELVSQLNGLFSQFDEACVGHGVDKIETIGDAYMAAAGFEDTESDPCVAVTRLAQDMLAAVAATHGEWHIRIGINVGPVVAGVIGTRNYAYHLWGDTVNVSSRLETTSAVDRIHVSEPVARAIADEFELEARGLVDLKGKGETATWFVLGHR